MESNATKGIATSGKWIDKDNGIYRAVAKDSSGNVLLDANIKMYQMEAVEAARKSPWYGHAESALLKEVEKTISRISVAVLKAQ